VAKRTNEKLSLFALLDFRRSKVSSIDGRPIEITQIVHARSKLAHSDGRYPAAQTTVTLAKEQLPDRFQGL
jgi:hypothetical protein